MVAMAFWGRNSWPPFGKTSTRSSFATSRGEDRTPEPLNDAYRSMDITDATQVNAMMGSTTPDVIIDTAAMTNVDACELDPPLCQLQNVTATENLLAAAKRHGSHFIFLSTDFIFDGTKGPYKETDIPAPLKRIRA